MSEGPEERLNLTSPATVRALLEAYGVNPRKSRGQNFLVSEGVLKKIVERSGVGAGDVVLEVGPGLGVLTRELVERARAVVAVELEPAFAEICRASSGEAASGKLAVVLGDALEIEPSMLAGALDELGLGAHGADPRGPGLLVANLPYSVAATVILRSFELLDTLERACVMVQSEVADRIAARPSTKDYGAYTVKLALLARVVGRFEVASTCFWPEPRVSSAVISLARVERADRKTLARASALADAAFAMRRKTLANNLRAAGIAREAVAGAIARLGLDERTRAEALAPEEFLELLGALDAEAGGACELGPRSGKEIS